MKKFIYNIQQFLNEKYPVNYDGKRNETQIFYFSSKNSKYKVKITPYQGREGYFSVGFGIDDDFLDYDTSIIVNENPYNVMDTIFNILSNFYNENDNKGFIFSFTGNKNKNNQRLLLYKRSIERYMPNAKLEYVDGIYYITLNK